MKGEDDATTDAADGTSSGRTEVIFALSLTPNSQLHQFPIQRARGRTAEGDDSVRERKEGEGEGGRFGAVRRIYQTTLAPT